jgi:ADP-ribose pyrophosphatase YjhB (NUDIX family)
MYSYKKNQISNNISPFPNNADYIKNKQSKYYKQQTSKLYCKNCNTYGHSYKNCTLPITSYGIICIDIGNANEILIKESAKFDGSINNTNIQYNTQTDIYNFCKYKDIIKFLMIRRKFTLGYSEFIRGRYDIENVDGIIFLFKQMTPDEIKNIETKSFDVLWNNLWPDCKSPYQMIEYNDSKQKFNNMKTYSENILPISFYTSHVKSNWSDPEWGFPKGRRNYLENDYECAIREFHEETGLTTEDYTIINTIPYIENFIGTNGLNYRHVYYLALNKNDKKLLIDVNNNEQSSEIGDISWMNYTDATNIIRPYHINRKQILCSIFTTCINILSTNFM